MELGTPRGFRDFSPEVTIERMRIARVIEEVFKRFGFYPIETPAVEKVEVLSAKAYGEDAVKELFKIEGEDFALRYDLTIPLARFVAGNTSMPMPFRRYHISRSWRKEEPQRMRYREFVQADIDIVGSDAIESESEILAAESIALGELGINDYELTINSRVILNGILTFFNIPEDKHIGVIRTIDKMHKIGIDELINRISALGVEGNTSRKLVEFITQEQDNEKKIETLIANIPSIKGEVEKIRKLMTLLETYALGSKIVLDLSLARGIDYYTGMVWEFIPFENGKRLPSLGGGGRYDKLIGIFAKKEVPAVGSTLGIDRVMDVVKSDFATKSYAKLYIATIGDDTYDYALGFANASRSAGIYSDLNITTRSISKQLDYANALGIRYVAIIGEQEKTLNKIKLRDMLSGNEELLSAQECIEQIKG